MKKLSFFVLVVFVLAQTLSLTSCGANPQGLDFYLKDDGTYAVAVGNARYLSKINIPGVHRGRIVSEIAEFGFGDRITDIELKVEEITIPSTVKIIGRYAFSSCGMLQKITFHGTVEQWNAIEFDYLWNINVSVREVNCYNGTVSIRK